MTTPEWDGALTDLEDRASIDSLEYLHQQRRQLMREYAALRVLHGPANRWDARRKHILSAIKVRLRMTPPPNGKWTEDAIDAAAHADDAYAAFLDAGIEAATRYVELENMKAELDERIENRSAALYAYSSEARLTR